MHKFANFIDEIAYQHYKYGVVNCQDNLESQRARVRAYNLHLLSRTFGGFSYSYYERLEDEINYNDCE